MGQETKRQLVQLHCFEGLSIRACSKRMGRNYRALHAVWRSIVAEASGEGKGAVEVRAAVRAYLDQGYRRLVEDSLPLVRDSAAHGAVAIKALEGLGRLHGVDGPLEGATAGALDLAGVGAQVRVTSPLLADKLERVQALLARSAEFGGESAPD
jgi:hypothetical protein